MDDAQLVQHLDAVLNVNLLEAPLDILLVGVPCPVVDDKSS